MPATTSSVEERLSELARAVERLEGRVAALERGAPRRAPSPGAAAGARPSGAEEEWDASQVTRALSLGGRTLLVLAGAFVLRALTDSGRIPAWMGVGLGFAYAGAWIAMADRAARAGQALSAGFHAAAAVVIGFPLLFEGATRFRLFSPAGAVATLGALTGVALLVASRRGMRAQAWIVSAGGALTALGLMAASGALVPGALYLALLGAATLWIGYVRDWTLLRWPVALVADLVALLVAVHAVDRGSSEGPGAALLVQATLVAVYLGSIATRTLYMGRKVVPFEMVQTGAVLAVGIGGAVWVALRTGLGHAGFGVAALLFGAVSYAVAFAFVARQRIRENFYFYTSVGIVLVVAGVALLLGEPARSIAFGVLAVILAVASRRQRSRTLASHAAAYALAAALASGLVAGSVGALFVGGAVSWSPGPGALAALLAGVACAWITGDVPRTSVLERIPPLAVDLAVLLGSAATAVAWLAPVVAGTGAATSPGALATLRTGALVGAVLAAAFAGRRAAFGEAAWLAYPLLGIGGLKILLEDLPRGRPASLVLGFALYGLALILVPRLRARKAAVAGASAVGTATGHEP